MPLKLLVLLVFKCSNPFDRINHNIFYLPICSCSSMDRTLVSGTEDLGSTPSGSAMLYVNCEPPSFA